MNQEDRSKCFVTQASLGVCGGRLYYFINFDFLALGKSGDEGSES